MWHYSSGQGQAFSLYRASHEPTPAVEVDLTQEDTEATTDALPSSVITKVPGIARSVGPTSNLPPSNADDASSGTERKVPSLTHWIKMDGGGECKLFTLIYKAAENLLEEKIENCAKGIPQDVYSGAQHLEKLNLMFPETLHYHPDVMTKRIKVYMAQVKKHVEDQQKTGQGMLDEKNYSQEAFEETRIFNLLKDANKGCRPPQSKKVFHGAQERYYKEKDAPASIGSLEESESCFLCGNEEDLVPTDMGKACHGCIQNQGSGEESLSKIKAEANKREEVAKVEQNKALFNKNNNDTQKTKTTNGKTGRKKRERYSDDDDDKDEKISDMLLSRLQTSEVKDKLQIEKLKLETEILRQKKLRMERNGQDSE